MSDVQTEAGVNTVALLERLEKLEARAAIGELMADYAHGCDEKDADRFMRIWHEDAVYDLGGSFGVATGHEEIRPKLSEIWELSPETRHWITDVTVDFSAPERATGNAHTICFVQTADGTELFCSAWYDNVYESREGTWRMAECHLTVHWWKQLDFNTLPMS
jgi:uncharacterized protein (TIGR02246 family)